MSDELEASGFTEASDDDGTTIVGTEGADTVTVTQHQSTFSVFGVDLFEYTDGVTVTATTADGTTTSRDYIGDDAQHLTIDTGGGADTINVDANVDVALTIRGGAGEDTISGGAGDDVIEGGEGRDYISGGKGDDVLEGGEGNDVVYGGRGDDHIEGGAGDDYLEGGKGDDAVLGGEGRDALSGGRGDDFVSGGAGDDTMYAGEGDDHLVGGAGSDRSFAGEDDRVDGGAGVDTRTTVEFQESLGSSVHIGTGVDVEGDRVLDRHMSGAEADAFRDRIEDDLDFQRSSPVGQGMLGGLDASGNETTIHRTDVEDNSWAQSTGSPGSVFTPGSGQDTEIGINPALVATFSGKEETPIEVLHHEMAHAYNFETGTTVDGNYAGSDSTDNDPRNPVANLERQAVGLPIDHDADPSTPDQTTNPDFATERGLSRELGREERPHYN